MHCSYDAKFGMNAGSQKKAAEIGTRTKARSLPSVITELPQNLFKFAET
jgi:hypothetical protein